MTPCVKPDQDTGSTATRATATGVLAAASVAHADANAIRASRQTRALERMRDPCRAGMIVACKPALLRLCVKPDQDTGSTATRATATGVLAAVSVAHVDANATRASRQTPALERMRDPCRAGMTVACMTPRTCLSSRNPAKPDRDTGSTA